MFWHGAAAKHHGWRASLVATAAVAFLGSGVSAAEDEREVPIGTFELGGPVIQSYTGQPSDGSFDTKSSSTRPQAPDETAKALFERALEVLEAGRTDEAQRLLEQVVARSPDSALAAKARTHLGDLYRTPSRAGGQGRAGLGVREAGAEVNRPQSGPGEERLAPSDIEELGQRVSAELEEEFISEAGDRVFFGSGSAELGSRARAVLASQARFIKRRPELRATVEGHADDAPLSADENKALSAARAEAVRERLIAEGIGAEKVRIAARGRENPVSECPDAACAAQNRRAVTVLYFDRARLGYGSPESPRLGGPVAAGLGAAATH